MANYTEKVWTLKSEVAECFNGSVITTDLSKWFKNEKKLLL